MSDVRCPMCGKPNPETNPTCQFCGARMRPIWETGPAADAADAQGAAQPGGEGDLPDWLSVIRDAESDESQSAAAATSGSDDGIPDWLRGLGDTAEPAAGASDASWLEDIRPDDASQPAAPDEGQDGLQETEIRNQQEPEPPAFGADANPEDQEQESPDWLSGAMGIAEPQAETLSNKSPDWVSEMRGVSSAPEEAGAPDGELPDWLIAAPASAGPDVEKPEGEGDQSIDWLADVAGSDDEAPQAPAAGEKTGFGLTGWLRSLPDAETAAAESGGPAGEQIPDWLSSSGKDSAESVPAEESGEPDWMSGLMPGLGDDADTSSDLPDWLNQEMPVLSDSGDEAATPFASDAAENSELPDWLSGDQLIEPDESPAAPAAFADLPDWLVQENIADREGEETPTFGSTAETPEWMSNQEEIETPAVPGEVPDWMREFLPEDAREAGGFNVPPVPADELAEKGAPTSGILAFAPDETEGGLDWLHEVEEAQAQAQAQEEAPEAETAVVSAFTAEAQDETAGEADLPDWFGEEQDLVASKPSGAALSPAELPGWLEAMRPVDQAGVAPFTEDTGPERAGPLSGLRGVLPAEPLVSQIRKPPAYGYKLQVTEDQQAHAELLAALVNSESEPPAIPRRGRITSQNVLRLVIALMLVLAVLVPVFVEVPISTPLFTEEHLAVNRLIESLSPGVPVLLAVDYEPGFAGEMDAIAAPVVDHLMLKGAYLALVSSTPTGPVQAERLIAQVNLSGNHSYRPIDDSGFNQYTNLGFIPGGQAGLLSFAETPQQALPLNLDRFPVWQGGPLLQVQRLADFSLVVVVTENPDRARDWIEQVQPLLGKTPLVMVISAQAEPVVRPYFNAGGAQIQGLITSLSGGVAYETINGRKQLASTYWPAFSLGILAAVVMIIAGGALNTANTLLAMQAERATQRRNLSPKTIKKSAERQANAAKSGTKKAAPSKGEGKQQ